MEVRQENVHRPPAIARTDKDLRLPLSDPRRRPALQGPGHCGPNGNYSFGVADYPRRFIRHEVILGVHLVVLDLLGPYRRERPRSYVQRDTRYPRTCPLYPA